MFFWSINLKQKRQKIYHEEPAVFLKSGIEKTRHTRIYIKEEIGILSQSKYKNKLQMD